MTRSSNPFSRPLRPSEIGLRGDISGKWSKLNSQEIVDLASIDDLVAQVQAKYGLKKDQAQKEVDGFARGRRL